LKKKKRLPSFEKGKTIPSIVRVKKSTKKKSMLSSLQKEEEEFIHIQSSTKDERIQGVAMGGPVPVLSGRQMKVAFRGAQTAPQATQHVVS
jgi:uncharacterized membrane protein